MITRLIGVMVAPSAIQIVEQHRPDATRAAVIHGPESATRLLGQVLASLLGSTENVVFENALPRALLALRPIAQGPYCVIERIHRRRHELRRRAPPIVDQRIERTQRFDVMPPQARNEYGIAGLD